MFFKAEDFSFKIDSVFFIERHKLHHFEHKRPFYALSYRIHGSAVFNRGKSDETLASDGCIALVPSNVSYCIDSSDEDIICIHFQPTAPIGDKILTLHTENRKYFESKFSELLKAWSKKQIGGKHECMAILHQIIYAIEREYMAEKPDTPAARILAAAEYINGHFTEKITVAQLAASFAMSDTYFRRLFTRQLGMTPVKYINKLKLDYALELLANGYLTVNEIADKCGFSNVSYFSLFIKKQTGLSPSQFFR